MLRHENAVLRRHGRVLYDPADRVWLGALARLIPRGRWAEIFPITQAALLAWHRRLAAGKYDTSMQRTPGRPAGRRQDRASPASSSAWRKRIRYGDTAGSAAN